MNASCESQIPLDGPDQTFSETDPGLQQSVRTLSGRVRSGPCSGIWVDLIRSVQFTCLYDQALNAAVSQQFATVRPPTKDAGSVRVINEPHVATSAATGAPVERRWRRRSRIKQSRQRRASRRRFRRALPRPPGRRRRRPRNIIFLFRSVVKRFRRRSRSVCRAAERPRFSVPESVMGE